jgi:hypothetical protein
MSQDALAGFVEETATKFGIPGVAAGVWANGREVFAYHGVTSVGNPLPVDHDTLFGERSSLPGRTGPGRGLGAADPAPKYLSWFYNLRTACGG